MKRFAVKTTRILSLLLILAMLIGCSATKQIDSTDSAVQRETENTIVTEENKRETENIQQTETKKTLTADISTKLTEETEPSEPEEAVATTTLAEPSGTEPASPQKKTESSEPTQPEKNTNAEPEPAVPEETEAPTEEVTAPLAEETEPPKADTNKAPITEETKAVEETQTEPTGCQHVWNEEYHAEEGHYGDPYVVCVCGYKCQTSEQWLAHVESIGGEEALLYHTSRSSGRDYIIDSPEYSEWICSKCGEVTTTHP